MNAPSVLGSSGLLAFLQEEPGFQQIEAALETCAVCGAANWSEVAQKVAQHGGDWQLAKATLTNYGLTVEPVTAADAELAATIWAAAPSLPLGDRLGLALAMRLKAAALTADAAWSAAYDQAVVIR
ncbi:MAG: hypothetical protein LBC97_13650 [Bifidobacteriaceae bacterium]|jgi:PIN domain nuclease of toxin-antitoxin system|nr:hypothetical protein [Bifidobacteriaceae bacterium]